MYLSNIKLWNFKKFDAIGEIDLSKPHLNLNLAKGLNVIIGENDSGKTAIIDAIKLVLKTHSYDYIRVDDKDFYKDAYRFRIELTFEDLIPEEAKNFTEWLGWNCLGLLIHGLTPIFWTDLIKGFRTLSLSSWLSKGSSCYEFVKGKTSDVIINTFSMVS